MPVQSVPITGNPLLQPQRNHLGDVAARQRDALPREAQGPLFCRTSAANASNSSARATSGVRSKPKASLISTALPSPGVTLAVGAIPTNDDAGVNQEPKVTSQGRRCDTMGAAASFSFEGNTMSRSPAVNVVS